MLVASKDDAHASFMFGVPYFEENDHPPLLSFYVRASIHAHHGTESRMISVVLAQRGGADLCQAQAKGLLTLGPDAKAGKI
jgi:hypothetical protein